MSINVIKTITLMVSVACIAFNAFTMSPRRLVCELVLLWLLSIWMCAIVSNPYRWRTLTIVLASVSIPFAALLVLYVSDWGSLGGRDVLLWIKLRDKMTGQATPSIRCTLSDRVRTIASASSDPNGVCIMVTRVRAEWRYRLLKSRWSLFLGELVLSIDHPSTHGSVRISELNLREYGGETPNGDEPVFLFIPIML